MRDPLPPPAGASRELNERPFFNSASLALALLALVLGCGAILVSIESETNTLAGSRTATTACAVRGVNWPNAPRAPATSGCAGSRERAMLRFDRLARESIAPVSHAALRIP